MKFEFNKVSQVLLKVAAVSTAAFAIISLWDFYRKNIWVPKISIKDVDYKKGEANLEVNKKPFFLQGNSEYNVGSNYGLKFGRTNTIEGKEKYDRIEILQDGLVRGVINKAGDEVKSLSDFGKTYNDDFFNGLSIK